MPEDQIHERIGAWESAGLIDGETAARLRAAEEGRVPAAGPMSASRPRSTFGPAPSIAEVLAYVGAAFLLAAWFVLLGAQADRIDDRNLVWLAAFAGAGIVSVVGGMLLRTGGEHASRASGVLFAVTVSCAYGAAYFLMARLVGDGDPGQQLGGAVAAVVTAILLRRRHPSLLTQAGLVGSTLSLAAGLSGVLRLRLLRADPYAASLSTVVLDLALWLGAAALLAFLAERELRRAGDPGSRRAGLTRLVAGLVAVIATAAILSQGGPSGDYEWGRVVTPIVAEGATVLVSVLVLLLAIRRNAPAFFYPGALGIVIALSDFNGQYVASQVGTGLALFLEGLIILGAGLVTDRIRRRFGRL
ncbi:MAG: hypothetical protein ABI555_03190 [Chloroflexota bacterium]